VRTCLASPEYPRPEEEEKLHPEGVNRNARGISKLGENWALGWSDVFGDKAWLKGKKKGRKIILGEALREKTWPLRSVEAGREVICMTDWNIIQERRRETSAY